MKHLIYLTLFFFIPFANFSQIDSTLCKELNSMVTNDQKWRGLAREVRNGEIDTITITEIQQNIRLVDSNNYLHLKAIFKKHGFPGFDIAGSEGSHNYWLLTQHMDRQPKFQKMVLKDMKVKAEANNASYLDYAYLIDRVKVNAGKPQVYGTQMQINADSTSYEPKPVENMEELDQLRNKAGLPPMDYYIKIMNERYFGGLKK